MKTSRSSRPTLPFARALGSAFLCGALALGTACNSAPFQAPKPQPEGQIDKFYEVNPIRDLDLLVLVDNSGSMAEEQEKLRKNFPTFIETLRKIPGGLPNLHLAVISSDVGAGNTFISGNSACNRPGGDRGQFQTKDACGLRDSKFITSFNNDTQKNFSGTLEEAFSCIANLGDQGCGFEHQFQSIRVALADGANSAFLRKDAFLAIIMITDEDDCSGPPESDLYADQSFEGQQGSLRCNIEGHLCDGARPPGMEFRTTLDKCVANPKGRLIPVSEFSKYILGLKPNNPERIIVSAITGLASKPDVPYAFIKKRQSASAPELLDIEPVCSAGADGTAAPSIRVSEFVKSFGQNGTLESICNSDYSPALKRIAELIAAKFDPGCISEKLIDVDDKTPGIQPECSVVDRVPNSAANVPDDKILPECGKGGSPCWTLQLPGAQGNNCPAGQSRVAVDRAGKEATPGTVQSIKCRSCALGDDPRCP